MSLTAIRANEQSDTLLDYFMLTSPDPLQAGASGAILTLGLSNPGRRVVTVQSLVVTLPVGTNAADLTADASGLQSQVPDGWNAQASAGTITLTPQGAAGQVGGGGLSFHFAAIQVNALVGLCAITVDETASVGTDPAQDRLATLSIPKFPTQFNVSDLQASPLDVASGGATTLMWSGTPAAYTLSYQPSDQGPAVVETVGSTGPYVAQGLTRANQVTFTLRVQVPVPGMDTPLMVERQATVSVETLSVTFEVEPTTVGANGLARLRWSAANAASCTLDPPGPAPIAASGTLYVVVPRTRVFTLNATDAAGNTLQRQCTVTVDPAIVPTTAGYVIAGANGAPGGDGSSGFGQATSAGGGGDGGDAVLTQTLPPLDTGSIPARVIPITLTGGNGAPGGNGGNDPGWTVRNTEGGYWHYPPRSPGGNGGNGGRGGDTKVVALFDASAGAPAQYVLTLAPGTGAAGGGPGYGTTSGSPGSAGRAGVVSLSFDGTP